MYYDIQLRPKVLWHSALTPRTLPLTLNANDRLIYGLLTLFCVKSKENMLRSSFMISVSRHVFALLLLSFEVFKANFYVEHDIDRFWSFENPPTWSGLGKSGIVGWTKDWRFERAPSNKPKNFGQRSVAISSSDGL